MRIALIVLFTFLTTCCLGQQDSTSTSTIHSPKRATILSATLPGAGQIYNKKYWKLPIVYGGLGLSIYYLDRNLKQIKLYRGDLIALQDDDPNTVAQTGRSESNLNELLDFYKNWRDMSYLAIGAVYALQILDANVDAHLFNFDVDEDLSLTVLPYMEMQAMDRHVQPVKGLHISFNF